VLRLRSLVAVCSSALLVSATAGAGRIAIRPAAVSVELSSSRAGARPVVLTMQLRYAMQCARPGPGPLVVSFPAGERFPARLAADAVLVDGHPATQVERTGRAVSVALPIEHGPLCDVIAPGVLELVFTRSAGIGNPSSPGRYSLTARTPRVSGRATMTIR
jgi:hypothetical protein